MKKGILIQSYMHSDILSKLKKKYSIFFNLPKKKALLSRIEILIVDIRKIDKFIYNKLINLKLIARFGVGYDNIDLKYIKSKNIKLVLTRKSVIKPVAEHALAFILISLKKICEFNNIVKQNKFNKKYLFPNTHELQGKNIFLIGFGAIGKQVAKLLINFGCKVSFYDPYFKLKNKNFKSISLAKGLKNADIVSIHMPLNKHTYKFIDKKKLALMKSNSVLVNTSRGKIVNEYDLIQKLKSNKNFIACLDVFYDEPLKKNHIFTKLRNTVLTPHVSTSTYDTKYSMSKEVYENIINFKTNKIYSKNFLKI